MTVKLLHTLVAVALLGGGAATARAQDGAGTGRVEVSPIVDARLRYEHVDQTWIEAEALTIRLRAGAEARLGAFSLLAEGEATAAPVVGYNAFPFALPGERQSRPGFAVVPDPENLELNRLQLRYKTPRLALTLGRQRIALDDQRWVGAVGWRQNEQTFDAVRGEATLGPVALDLTYAIDQRTIFGADAGPRTGYRGDHLFAGLSSKLGPVRGKLFAYLLDYDEGFFLASSSQTYGVIVSVAAPVRTGTKPGLRASYARQSGYGANPFAYAADYWAFDANATLAGFLVTAGWEELGSGNGRAVQTPMATLHKFNGWADIFLTTPAAGLQDAHVSVSRKFDGFKPLRGLNASIGFHQFESATGDREYGNEWNASIGFKLGQVDVLAKFASYQARGHGADTRKFWLQAEWLR